MEIKTKRLILRSIRIGDEKEVHEYAGDKELTMMYWLPNDTFEETVDFVKKNAEEWNSEDQTNFEFVIILDGKIIGGCDCDLGHSEDRSYATLGWIINKKYRKKGYASEAAAAVLGFAFENLGIDKVYAQCDINNAASFAVMRKIGMKCINDKGTRTYPRTGEISGEYTCLITRDEWKPEENDKRSIVKTVEILGANRFENYTKTRNGSRAIIIEDGKILRFPGVSCAYRDVAGRETLKYDGVADKENSISVDGSTAFPACSISKFVTALTVMRLQEQDMLNIDEPVNRYLHQWKLLTPDGKESDATIRLILNHTSGIVDGEDSFYGLRRNDPEVSLLDVLEGRTPYNKRRTASEKQPGTEFEYSDAGYCVLQLMIQDIAGSAFEEIAAKFVFEPLGLKKTFFASIKNIELREKEQNMASGYDSEGVLIPGKYPQIPDLAASGLWSTPYELMLIAKEFNEAVNGRSSFLSKESAQEMLRPNKNFSWVGLGLFLRGDDTIVSQGWGENGQSMLKMNFVTGEISVVMTNMDPGVDQTESGVELLMSITE